MQSWLGLQALQVVPLLLDHQVRDAVREADAPQTEQD